MAKLHLLLTTPKCNMITSYHHILVGEECEVQRGKSLALSHECQGQNLNLSMWFSPLPVTILLCSISHLPSSSAFPPGSPGHCLLNRYKTIAQPSWVRSSAHHPHPPWCPSLSPFLLPELCQTLRNSTCPAFNSNSHLLMR